MYVEGLDQWFKINKNFTTPVNEWSKAATDMCRHIAQENLEILEENFTRASDQLKRFSNIKKPEDFFNLQRDYINEEINATIKNMQKLVHMSVGNVEEFTKLCGTVAEKMTEKATTRSTEKGEKEAK